MPGEFKVGVTTGLYRVAGAPELGSVIKKIGYALTRGTNVIEISGDVPHEINYTEGKELRYISEKQGIDLLLHGSLTVLMASADMEGWGEAQDHIEKSIRSAVFGGAKYVLFHSSLRPWPELVTYAEAKVRIIMVDSEGRFIAKLMEGEEDASRKLRKWFVNKFWQEYAGYILSDPERREIEEKIFELRRKEKIPEEIAKEEKKLIKEVLDIHLKEGKDWKLREVGNENDAYKILAHSLFFKRDRIWAKMTELYREEIAEVDYAKDGTVEGTNTWIEEQFKKAEKDRRFERIWKEFFNAVVAAKFLEAHIFAAFKTFIEKNLSDEFKKLKIEEEEKRKLFEIMKNLKITIEIPDARSPEYAGLYRTCRPKQIYVAVLATRERLKQEFSQHSEKVFMTVDFEHIATHGIDPLEEIRKFSELVPDAGKVILSLHVTKPTPLHHHMPIEIGDVEVYRLLWFLRNAGLGKFFTTYLIFERGGETDPFKRSVTALKIMKDHLEKEIPPEKLSPEFFGVTTGEIASEERQLATIREHARDPLKGLITVPEEAYTFLGRAATEKGKRPEEWKKEELR